MSIKSKIALYNTFLMCVLVGLVLVFMSSMSNTVVESSSKNQLKYIVHENAEEVEWDGGKLDVEDINFYENHVTTLIYSSNGVLLEGGTSYLEEFEEKPLTHEQVSSLLIGGVTYFIYDFFVESRKHEGVFVRGIISVTEVSETVQSLFSITLLVLPFFILCAGFGSYAISKKWMRPLEKMIDTATEISHGDDLSQRIDLGTGKDELHHLSETFDTMFFRLEQAFLAEKQFTSDVSHELRTPTAVILAECEYLLNNRGTEEEQEEGLILIQRQGKKMQLIIATLLHFVRMDNGVLKPKLEAVDMSELVTLVCEEQESVLELGKTLETQVPEGIVCRVDYGMMIRVLSNLVDNGFKYGKEGGYVKVSLEEEEKNVTLTVEDNGIGISPEDKEKIFHRFYKVEGARTAREGESMGLGLAMVEQIVKSHGGTITLESVLGEGSRFVVHIPDNRVQ